MSLGGVILFFLFNMEIVHMKKCKNEKMKNNVLFNVKILPSAKIKCEEIIMTKTI